MIGADSCKLCKYYGPHPAGIPNQGACMRYPPTVQLVPTVTNLGQPTVNIHTVFPIVREEQFCGEYKIKLSLKN